MPRRKLTKPLYTKLFEAYSEQFAKRLEPGARFPNYAAAARTAGCSHMLARRTYLHGWDLGKYPYARAVSEDVNDTMVDARALAAAKLRQQNEQERLDTMRQAMRGAATVHAEEGKLVGAVRASAGLLLAQTVKLAQAGRALAVRAAEQLEHLATAEHVDLQEALSVLGAVGRQSERCARLVDAAMDLERKHLGEPLETVKHEHHLVLPTEQEAIAVLAELEGADAVAPLQRRLRQRQLERDDHPRPNYTVIDAEGG
jgi:hypothetical protein